MNEVQHVKGNGAAKEPAGWTQDTRSLGDHGRQIRDDAATLAGTVQDATDGVQHFLTEQVKQRPYSALGIAAGIGYAMGGGLSSRLTTVVLAAATRMAMALAAREVGARLLPSSSTTVPNPTS